MLVRGEGEKVRRARRKVLSIPFSSSISFANLSPSHPRARCSPFLHPLPSLLPPSSPFAPIAPHTTCSACERSTTWRLIYSRREDEEGEASKKRQRRGEKPTSSSLRSWRCRRRREEEMREIRNIERREERERTGLNEQREGAGVGGDDDKDAAEERAGLVCPQQPRLLPQRSRQPPVRTLPTR
eukprot:661063-Hanusia_phi.AAC.1